MTLHHGRLHRRRHVVDAHQGDSTGHESLAADSTSSSLAKRAPVPQYLDFNNAEVEDEEVATIVQTVYQTLTPTFDGPIAGYSTLVQDAGARPSSIARKQPQMPPPPPPPPTPIPKPDPRLSPSPSPRPSPGPSPSPSPSPRLVSSAGYQLQRPSNSQAANIYPLQTVPSSNQAPPTPTGRGTLSRALDLGSSQAPATPNAVAAGSSTQSTAVSKSNGDNGSSMGAKVGIAFGVLGGMLAVGLLVFFLFNRHRKQASQRQRIQDDDEKPRVPVKSSPRGSMDRFNDESRDPKAPRVSLRPVTQFLPHWNNPDKNRSANTSDFSSYKVGGERGSPSNSSNLSNPFGNQAESFTSSSSDEQRAQGPDASGAVGALSRKTSMRKDGPNKVDLTLPRLSPIPVSPAGTEFSMSLEEPGTKAPASKGAAAIAAAGGPRNSGVHRVHLDFNPTLDDEMQLRSGELVRLLHEFDDGWALVIRLDRSQQGVCPRTCLSTRPVKPRPNPGAPRVGPPVKTDGQAKPPPLGRPQRPMTPQGGPGLPQSPAPLRKNQNRPGDASAAKTVSSDANLSKELPTSPDQTTPSPTLSEASSVRKAPEQGLSRPSDMAPRGPPAGPPPQPPVGPPTGPVGRKPVPGKPF
ncbi:hypothetical protein CDD82_5674 [Ophiocordyceps australis]|uniref:SH3 domain-containing protein n=1 Tax=Ophiocordyceps australis TaxID=1399860 RepID=A0A2C5Y4N3_9HYPO|nr:hypothetical protein CDD82_5674 [Ophiocordyceps australis]